MWPMISVLKTWTGQSRGFLALLTQILWLSFPRKRGFHSNQWTSLPFFMRTMDSEQLSKQPNELTSLEHPNRKSCCVFTHTLANAWRNRINLIRRDATLLLPPWKVCSLVWYFTLCAVRTTAVLQKWKPKWKILISFVCVCGECLRVIKH